MFAGNAVPRNSRIIECDPGEVNDRSWILSIRNGYWRGFGWLAVCVLLLVSVSYGCGGREGKAERLYDEAKQELREGRLEEAVERFNRIADEYADTDAARKAREEILLYRGLSDAVDLFPVREARDVIVGAARAVQRYRHRRRAWPESLDQLVPDYMAAIPVDPWGRELVYRRKSNGRGYWMACYGSDGEIGGEGQQADWFIEDGEFVHRLSRNLR